MRMRMSIIDVGMRLGDAIDPFQLANGFEAVIGYECQERSNPLSLILTMHTSHARCDKASEWVGGSEGLPRNHLHGPEGDSGR